MRKNISVDILFGNNNKSKLISNKKCTCYRVTWYRIHLPPKTDHIVILA